MPNLESKLARSKPEQTVGWLVLGILLLGCLLVMRPFVSALLWALVLSFSTWPVYRRLLRWMGGRRTVAATLLSLSMILVILLPFVVVGVSLGDNVADVSTAVKRWIDEGPPDPPAWLGKVPLVGEKATEKWEDLAADSTQLWVASERLIEPVSRWALRIGLALGGGLIELTLSIFIAFFFFRDGAAAAERLTYAVTRIGGEHGTHLLTVAGNTVRGVVYGILGTALLQALMAGFGYLIAGVPGPALLALLTFFSSVIPILGTGIVWVPVGIWLFHQGKPGWAIFMFAWGLAVASIDNVVKPLLISHGSHMPFILIFLGVLGGALAFGFIGVFLGPTLLAVGFRVLDEWAAATRAAGAQGKLVDKG